MMRWCSELKGVDLTNNNYSLYKRLFGTQVLGDHNVAGLDKHK